MSDRAFVDTNVLVYAHDSNAGRKHQIAVALIEEMWSERSGVLSTQVLHELYVNVRRIAVKPMDPAGARELVEDYLTWETVVNDGSAILAAIDLEQRYGISFWDALIVQAANACGVDTLYTEDLNHGQHYGSVQAINPFLQDSADRVHEGTDSRYG
jgi:predicted nucleic acid-binding protein